MRRALAIDEACYGPNHPNVAISLNNMATLLYRENGCPEAEQLFRRALAIVEASYGTEHPDVANRLMNLASLLSTTNRLSEAEPLMRQALAINEHIFGDNHPNIVGGLYNLAFLLSATNRVSEAELLHERCLRIMYAQQQTTGHNHPRFEFCKKNYIDFLTEHRGTSKAQAHARIREVLGHK